MHYTSTVTRISGRCTSDKKKGHKRKEGKKIKNAYGGNLHRNRLYDVKWLFGYFEFHFSIVNKKLRSK